MPEFTPDALIRVMRDASDDLKARVAPLVGRAAQGLAGDLRRAYLEPMLRRGTTGNLADHVTIREYHRFMQQVRQTAKHVHLYELGTRDRYARTRQDVPLRTPAYRGRMPAHPTFVSLAVTRRAEMLRDAEAVIGSRYL